MTPVAALGEDEELVVLAPFEPVPLEGVLSARGFSRHTTGLSHGGWQVTFRRVSWPASSLPQAGLAPLAAVMRAGRAGPGGRPR